MLIKTAIATLALAASAAQGAVPVYGYVVKHTYPHDPGAFTQGLFYQDGLLYESTGLNGRSSVRKVELETGKVLLNRAIPAAYFGEGIAPAGNRIVSLTWTNQIGFIFDMETLQPQGIFPYQGEGWALTSDGTRLYMSDGSAYLRVLDPNTMRVLRRIHVTADAQPVTQLNELEWVEGEIYANVWQTDRIARIDPFSGRVLGWIDLTGLDKLAGIERGSDNVPNGIAYDSAKKRLFVTGKLWPKLFEIELKKRP
ncbi:glutamine cyclotransferase [Pseudoduganella flava]|uniref:Glutamine cyclotransferase n=1 Tax=Pseudoduganella flava TaxID=871742 RepID=A0A562Q519_9BURK|nr:glutaminyl-peptide cyclotransferase [Pseudoduganella flava]QGZ41184.1 glutaminyl-peptide cyclotransferase [Pseudoduganella flava]TWI51116.1 glutamine cyclotransferase [Pseudoduganella flava]